MIQNINVLTDVNGVPIGGLAWAREDLNFSTTLLTTADQYLQVPEGVNIAIMSFVPNGCWAAQTDDTSAIDLPGSSFSNTAAEQDPPSRSVIPGKYLHFIASTTTYVQVRFGTNNKTPV